jgi:hypothetical protein
VRPNRWGMAAAAMGCLAGGTGVVFASAREGNTVIGVAVTVLLASLFLLAMMLIRHWTMRAAEQTAQQTETDSELVRAVFLAGQLEATLGDRTEHPPAPVIPLRPPAQGAAGAPDEAPGDAQQA